MDDGLTAHDLRAAVRRLAGLLPPAVLRGVFLRDTGGTVAPVREIGLVRLGGGVAGTVLTGDGTEDPRVAPGGPEVLMPAPDFVEYLSDFADIAPSDPLYARTDPDACLRAVVAAAAYRTANALALPRECFHVSQACPMAVTPRPAGTRATDQAIHGPTEKDEP